VQLDVIARLRLSFLALGLLLLVPLGWLMHSVNVRVEAQRRLRHQVVAERIFDELERELTRVLEQESARPSSAFDQAMPSPSWEPYVVGYFTTDGAQNRLLDAQSLSPERRRRLSWALAHDGVIQTRPKQQLGALEQSAPSPDDVTAGSGAHAKAASAPSPAMKAGGSLSPAEVLRKLNRAKDERQQSTVSGASR
jgi:hypothetical protein